MFIGIILCRRPSPVAADPGGARAIGRNKRQQRMALHTNSIGSVAALYRYPVKSMQGEELAEAMVAGRGILGDRAYAIRDRRTGYIASAKHPRKWGSLLACKATFVEPPIPGAPLPPVRIALPDGTVIRSDQPDADRLLSRALGRDVMLISEAPAAPTREANRAAVDAIDEEIREEPMALAAPAGSLFDHAVIHLITTATLARLRTMHPEGRFDARRFRPNIVVEPEEGGGDFIEEGWLGHELLLGPSVELRGSDPAPRCVITTLAQGDLPGDPGILRAIARKEPVASVTIAPGALFPAVAGIYADIIQGGALCRHDQVALRITAHRR